MAVSKKRKKVRPDEEAWRKHKVSNRKAIAWLLAVPAAAFGIAALFRFDASGPVEVADATVVATSQWDHVTPQGTHQHTSAVLEVDGSTASLEKADGAMPGGTMKVKVQRGWITGRVTILGPDAPPPAMGSIPGVPVPGLD